MKKDLYICTFLIQKLQNIQYTQQEKKKLMNPAAAATQIAAGASLTGNQSKLRR